MRLPADAALIVVNRAEADPAVAALLAVWSEEALPVFHVDSTAPGAFAGSDLEASLDAVGATTLVVCGGPPPDAVAATARDAAGRGYRVFLVGDAAAADAVLDDVRAVTCETALAAGLRARARERWRAARVGVVGGT